jgi:hypothetical protein
VSIRRATEPNPARKEPADPTRVQVDAPAIGHAVRTAQPDEDKTISCAHDAGGRGVDSLA